MRRIVIFLVFLFLVLAIYSPLINKGFASDDFAVLRRVVFFKHGILIKGFFRPLSDITLYSNYLVAGFHPLLYNLFNLVSHACIVYMVFLIAGRIAWIPEQNRRFFSWLAALLFLSYPFHNESIVWGVGRASLMAALFGTMALLVAVSSIKVRWKYFLACLFYFIGLSGYESILVLPGILLLLYDRQLPLRHYIPWVVWMGVTLAAHLVLRVLVSGVLWGNYGSAGMGFSTEPKAIKYLKVLGRVFLPPMEQSNLLSVLFVALMLLLTVAVMLLWKRRKENAGFGILMRFSGMLTLALLIPLLFGISTRTYEGDRLFYFPSVFVAFWLAALVVFLFQKRWALMVGGTIIVYQCIFLSINIHNWYRASAITEQIIGVVKDRPNQLKKALIVNLPQEYEGAHVLRNGFYDALWLQGVDTSRIQVVNYVTTEQMRAESPLITPEYRDGLAVILPQVTIVAGAQTGFKAAYKSFMVQADTSVTDIFYWNKEKLVQLK